MKHEFESLRIQFESFRIEFRRLIRRQTKIIVRAMIICMVIFVLAVKYLP